MSTITTPSTSNNTSNYKRPKTNSSYTYDDYGYLWDSEEDSNTFNDLRALNKNRRRVDHVHGNNGNGEKYEELRGAYGDVGVGVGGVVSRTSSGKKKKIQSKHDKDKIKFNSHDFNTGSTSTSTSMSMSLSNSSMRENEFNFNDTNGGMLPTGGGGGGSLSLNSKLSNSSVISMLPPLAESYAYGRSGGSSRPRHHRNHYHNRKHNHNPTISSSSSSTNTSSTLALAYHSHITRTHAYDLKVTSTKLKTTQNTVKLNLYWQIENLKNTIPIAFLKVWGVGGEVRVRKSIKCILNVGHGYRMFVLKRGWKILFGLYVENRRRDSNAKLIAIDRVNAFHLFDQVYCRFLKGVVKVWFARFVDVCKEFDICVRENKLNDCAIVIQKWIKCILDERVRKATILKAANYKVERKRLLCSLVDFEYLHVRCIVAQHRINMNLKHKEDQAASIIRRCYKCFKSRCAIYRVILKSNEVKRQAHIALQTLKIGVIMKAYHDYKDRLGLYNFRGKRRERLDREQVQRDLVNAEENMGIQLVKDRNDSAAFIAKCVKSYLFVQCINNRVCERRVRNNIRYDFEVKNAKVIQKNFRMFRFFLSFTIKTDLRLRNRLAAEEAFRLKQDEVAAYLQNRWRRCISRHNLTMRFANRLNLLTLQAIHVKQTKAALKIQVMYSRFQGRENLKVLEIMKRIAEEEVQRKRLELSKKKAVLKERNRAAGRIQRGFKRFKFMKCLNERIANRRKLKLERIKVENDAAAFIQRNFRLHRFRKTFNQRVQERINAAIALHILRTNSASIIQHTYRVHRFLAIFNAKADARKRAWIQAAKDKAHAEYLRMLDDNAYVLQRFCKERMRRYNLPVRILARRQVSSKRRSSILSVIEARRNAAAVIIQDGQRRRRDRHTLLLRFTKRRGVMERKGLELKRHYLATLIQHCYLRHLDRVALRQRVVQRCELNQRIAMVKFRHVKARVIQRCFRGARGRYVGKLKVEVMRRRIEKGRLMEEQTALAEVAARRGAEARFAAEEALQQMVDQGWKLGSDGSGRNYYYNWVTGESTFIKPPGWKIKPTEIWIKNQDALGNTYYYNQLTQETKWMPPCDVCHKEMGRKICKDCNDVVYCEDCFDTAHRKFSKDEEHTWRAADVDKDELNPGEKFCVRCNVTAAKRVCKTCRDAYCEGCYRDVHAAGWLSKHTYVTWEEFKKGWQEVRGKVEGEKDYYFNATTQESTYQKPEELMLDEELVEYRLHKKFEKENEKNAKKVEKLTEKLAQSQYEKDQLWFDINLQKTAENEELEILRKQLLDKDRSNFDNFKRVFMNPREAYKEWRVEKRKVGQLYRRKLLLSAKQRENLQIHVPVAENTLKKHAW